MHFQKRIDISLVSVSVPASDSPEAQELARAEASSRKVLVADEDGALDIDGAQLHILRQIVHAGMARKGRVLGTPEEEAPQRDPPGPPSRRGPP